MSMENTVLAELAHRAQLDADLLFIDTGWHFPETLAVANEVEERSADLPLVRVKPLLRIPQKSTRRSRRPRTNGNE